MYSQLETMQEPNSVSAGEPEGTSIKIKAPKRVLHFSDGVMEEYSDDDVDSAPPKEQTTVVDPKTLTWIPWMNYFAWAAGSKALAVCDYLGESLASALGITTPRYWYEIEEYKRLEAEKQEREKQAEGWSAPTTATGDINLDTIKTNQPAPSAV